VGGDQIKYTGDRSTRTAVITTQKNIINIIVSTKGARFLVIAIIFLFEHPLGRYEYMIINLSSLAQEVINK
jgi:hypothetical protein